MTTNPPFSKEKAVAALAFIAAEAPGLSAAVVSKVIFFAEKCNANRFAGPVVGDELIRTRNGPVPSTIHDYLHENWARVAKPKDFSSAVRIRRTLWLRSLHSGTGEADLSLLSQTDIQSLREALRFCEGKSKRALSGMTRQERAWKRALNGCPIDYADLIDDQYREEFAGR